MNLIVAISVIAVPVAFANTGIAGSSVVLNPPKDVPVARQGFLRLPEGATAPVIQSSLAPWPITAGFRVSWNTVVREQIPLQDLQEGTPTAPAHFRLRLPGEFTTADFALTPASYEIPWTAAFASPLSEFALPRREVTRFRPVVFAEYHLQTLQPIRSRESAMKIKSPTGWIVASGAFR